MDQGTAPRRLDDRGISSVQFVLASALALVLFLALANLVVVQYGRGAIRSALEQGARAGSVSGAASCEATAASVLQDLLGGRMSDQVDLFCEDGGAGISATAVGTFESWTPFTPDFEVSLTSAAVIEP